MVRDRYIRLRSVVLAGGFAVASAFAGPQPGPEGAGPSSADQARRPTSLISRTPTPIKIDGVLDDSAWSSSLRLTLDYEWFPGENSPAPVDTEVFLTYDDDNLYVGFRAQDPDPSAVRAHLMDRDEINTLVQDDHVLLMIDTFNDERRAFQFRVNPLGVQADAIFSELDASEDFSWDVLWESAGRLTQQGYEVELAIPMNQLRFPATSGDQTSRCHRSIPSSPILSRVSANSEFLNVSSMANGVATVAPCVEEP